MTDQVKVLQTFQTKSWKNWKTARPPIYKRTSKNLLKGPPRYEDIEWTNSEIFIKSLTENLKRKLWITYKIQTQSTIEPIDSSSQKEQFQATTKNSSIFWNKEK